MPNKTLSDVIGELLDNPTLMGEILDDPLQALTDRDWTLSDEEMSTLSNLVSTRKNAELFSAALFRNIQEIGVPWVPPAWGPDYPYSKLVNLRWPF